MIELLRAATEGAPRGPKKPGNSSLALPVGKGETTTVGPRGPPPPPLGPRGCRGSLGAPLSGAPRGRLTSGRSIFSAFLTVAHSGSSKNQGGGVSTSGVSSGVHAVRL